MIRRRGRVYHGRPKRRTCTKAVSYPTEAAAQASLEELRALARAQRGCPNPRGERHVHYCFQHRAYHLTSQRARSV